MRIVFIILLAGLVCLSGCKTIEPELPPPLPLTVPDRFSLEGENDGFTGNWWLSFGSDELNGFIKNAVDHNFDLQIIRTKITQAIARVEKQEAGFFPDLSASLGGQKKGHRLSTPIQAVPYMMAVTHGMAL